MYFCTLGYFLKIKSLKKKNRLFLGNKVPKKKTRLFLENKVPQKKTRLFLENKVPQKKKKKTRLFLTCQSSVGEHANLGGDVVPNTGSAQFFESLAQPSPHGGYSGAHSPDALTPVKKLQ